MNFELWFYTVAYVLTITLPILLFSLLYIGFMEYRGLFQVSGLTAREVGLLIVGSITVGIPLLGNFNLPIIVSKDVLLAMNVGGAIIPIVLSIYLLAKQRLNLALTTISIIVVSIATFKITKVKEGSGIVSEFPYFLIPSLLAVLIALLIYRRDVSKGAPFAYAVGTLGTLIGADVYHLPELFETGFLIGSIGGAGVYDMVFISGFLAMMLVFPFASKELKALKRRYSPDEEIELKVRFWIKEARTLLAFGRYHDAVVSAYKAVSEKIRFIGGLYGIKGEEERVLDILGFDYIGRYNFEALSNSTKNPYIDPYEAWRNVLSAEFILNSLKEVERRRYAPLPRRILAYLIDLIIIITILFLLLEVLIHYYEFQEPYELLWSPWFIAWFMWAWVIQIFYFTLFETIWGQSPGKKIANIMVVSRDLSRCDFIGAFTRNVVRFLDIFLFFYLISIIMISSRERMERIGDYVAKTVVVKVG